jgi:hypothetical protein
MDFRKIAFSDANVDDVLRAVPIRGLFHTAWAISDIAPTFEMKEAAN